METKREIQNETVSREWETSEHSILNGVSPSHLFFRAQGVLWKRKQNDHKSQWRWKTLGKQDLLNTAGLMHICIHGDYGSVHTGPTKVLAWWGPSTERGNGHKAHLSPRSYFQLITAHKGKISFLQWWSLGIQTTLKGSPFAQQKAANTKWTQWQFWRLVVS